VSRAAALAAIAAVILVASSAIGWSREEVGTMPSSAQVLDGALLFRTKGCSVCHYGPESAGMGHGEYPDLSDAPRWAGGRREGMSAEEYVRQSILIPAAFKSPAWHGQLRFGMPTLSVSESEVDALVAYLLSGSLRRPHCVPAPGCARLTR
jgi:mono/diheme cytochrome c family protein